MADERSWIDRVFGTGVLFSLASVLIAFWGIYQATARTNQALNQVKDQETLRNEITDQLKNTDKAMSELKDRLVKLETSLTVTKVEAQGAALQANVARLQTEYNAPDQRDRLNAFGLNFGNKQRTFADMMSDLHANPAAVESLPQPPTLPGNLDFLKPDDKTHLESILVKTKENWSPPPAGLLFPHIDWTKFQQLPPPEKPKSFPEQALDTVKAYPAIAILLVLFLIGSALKK